MKHYNCRMDSPIYQAMLDTYLISFGPIIGGQNWTFQQGGTPYPSSKSTWIGSSPSILGFWSGHQEVQTLTQLKTCRVSWFVQFRPIGGSLKIPGVSNKWFSKPERKFAWNFAKTGWFYEGSNVWSCQKKWRCHEVAFSEYYEKSKKCLIILSTLFFMYFSISHQPIIRFEWNLLR